MTAGWPLLLGSHSTSTLCITQRLSVCLSVSSRNVKLLHKNVTGDVYMYNKEVIEYWNLGSHLTLEPNLGMFKRFFDNVRKGIFPQFGS